MSAGSRIGSPAGGLNRVTADELYLTEAEADAQYLQISNNLSDVASASTARSNISVYSISEVDTLLTNKQPLDATLTALAAYNTNGILTQTAADTFVGRTITGTNDRLTVTNGNGVSGNPTLDIASTYVGQTSITTLGTIGTGTWQGTSISTTYTDAKLKTLTGTTDRVTIGGTATDPTVDIAATYVGQNTITTLGTITTGVWTGTDIAIADGGTGASTAADARTNLGLVAGGAGDIWVEKAGDSMTGNLLVTGGAGIGIGATPSSVVLFHLKKDQDNVTDAIYENQDTGTAAQVRFQLRNGSSALDGLTIGVLGTGFTTNGGFIQDSAYLSAESNLAGMSFIARSASGILRFYTGGFAAANERMHISSAGLVGMGITPLTALHVKSSADPEIRLTSNTGGVGNYGMLTLLTSTNGVTPWVQIKGLFSAAGDGDLTFSTTTDSGTNLVERMRITDDGLVGINNDNPSSPLTVTSDNTYGMTLESKTTSAANNILRMKSLGVIGGASSHGRIRFIDNDGTDDITTGDFISAHNNPAGSRYFGFIAQHDRDGEKYPLRFFTEPTGSAAAITSFYIGADADQGKVIVGNSTTTLGVLSVYAKTGVTTLVARGASGGTIMELQDNSAVGVFRVQNTGDLRITRSDTTVSSGDSLGRIEFTTNDATVTTAASQVGAYILVTANADFTTDAAQSIFRIYTMDATAGGSPLERLTISPTSFVINEGGIDHDFRVEGDTNTSLIHADASTDRVGINIAAPTGKLDIDQSSTTGAIPVLQLDQADVSEEFISFLATIGTGNSIEAVGAKTLTTTHFIKVKIQGGLIRYFPVGTIA